ncbi:MAG: glycosyltransferase, partial [Lysobacteraceae bacterium]
HRAIVVSAGGRLLPALQAIGAEHVTLGIGSKSPLILRHVPALRRLFRDTAADIVHARSRLPAWLVRAALRGGDSEQPRPHFVTTVHGMNSPGRYSRVMTSGERVICVSDSVRAYVLRHYPAMDTSRLQVIPRGIDPNVFPRDFSPSQQWRAQLDADYPQLANGRLLLLPGRGTRLKGHAHAIDLLAALRATGVDARLLLAGAQQSGRDRYLDELRARIAAVCMQDFVAITPPRGDMRELYAISDLVLQLSDKPESFGRSVLEAIASGKPVLGWDHGGVGEQLHALYPVGAVALGDAPQLLRRAIELLHAPPSLPATIPDRYTLARMQHDTLALYSRLARA